MKIQHIVTFLTGGRIRNNFGRVLILSSLLAVTVPPAAYGILSLSDEPAAPQTTRDQALNQEEPGELLSEGTTGSSVSPGQVGLEMPSANDSIVSEYTQDRAGTSDLAPPKAKCAPGGEAIVDREQASSSGPAAEPVNESTTCNTQVVPNEQTITLAADGAPTTPEAMTADEISLFMQLPSVASGEITIPPLAPTVD